MTTAEQRQAAKQFAEYWKGKGYEKGQSQPFWLSLLRDVYGVEHPEQYILFEEQVRIDNTSFIDGTIESTHVLIEQKSVNKDLNAPIKQSDGTKLTPFQQAKRYSAELPYDQRPRWIVTCNFKEFYIYDMQRPTGDPEILKLADLEKEYYRLQFLIDTGNESIKKEMEISLQAGELVGILYDELLKQYINPKDPETLKSLNAFCVRLVFCLYAEDAEIFGGRNMFHDYLKNHRNEDRNALINLFVALDTKPEDRDRYMVEDLAAFPYVNGGLFANENIEIPRLGDKIIDLILNNASADFNWSDISPTIFGAVFESTLNPETRRSGGMHYTSIENIHKVIDPLFLDSLKVELLKIKDIKAIKDRKVGLQAFQNKIAMLKFFDPACGSGNFLTETYLSLRRLENETIVAIIDATKGQVGGQVMLDFENPIKVSIGQLYGIEINDFAVKVAKTALWIAENQMMKETEDVVKMTLDYLPLKSYEQNIVEYNALHLDWESVVPRRELNYIMGNPPFSGGMKMSVEKKNDMKAVLGKDTNGVGEMDYVAAWYYKATTYIDNTSIECAFVSTNSIVQGQQAITVWEPLLVGMKIFINFAYRTFKWSSDATEAAAVNCVIIGFSKRRRNRRMIFDESGHMHIVNEINSHLVNAGDWFVHAVRKPIYNVPPIRFGSMPRGKAFVLSPEQRNEIVSKYPFSDKYIKKFYMGNEFIKGTERYCLWLLNADPSEYRKCPPIMNRIEEVRNARLESDASATRKLANTPTLFAQIAQPDSDYIAVPAVSSERRRYIPIGFLSKDIIAGNKLYIIPGGTIYNFGILTSNVHMAWMRAFAGRLEMRYSYSKDIVYNNFPWPKPTVEQKAKIEQTAQAILDVRNIYPNCSLADLYDEVAMPPELRKAHQENDRAVMLAYNFWGKLNSETECVIGLMKMYQSMVKEQKD